MVLERISSVATVERTFDRNRDIVDQGMSDETDSAIGGPEPVNDFETLAIAIY